MLFFLPAALFASTNAVRRMARSWMQGIQLGLRWLVGLDSEIRGLDKLPEGPVILAMKHQSAWETMILYMLRLDIVSAVKHELASIPLFGWYVTKLGSIKLDRGGAAKTMRQLIKDARQAIRNGDSVVIFPEGTRRAPGAEPDYKPGVAALYGALDVPCVPVALNSGCYWGRRSFMKRPGTIKVSILEAIPPGLDRKAFMAVLQERIESETARLVDEAG